jgi:hypothetical protein
VKPEELDRLIHRYFEGDLSPEEEGLLWSVIRIDPAAADRFVELSELESAMVESLRAEEAAPPEVRSARRESRRLTRVVSAPAERRPIWPLFLAAGVMIGFVALLLQSAGTPRPAPVDVVRQPELAKPKPPAEPLPAPPEPVPPKRTEAPHVDAPAPAPRGTPEAPPPKPAEPPRAPEPRPPQKPEPAAPEKTIVADATNEPRSELRIERVEGEVVDDAGALAKADQAIAAGRGLEVRKGSAVVALADGTKVELRADTRLDKFVLLADQRKFQFTRGTASAIVAKQPARMPVVIQTPHAELTVLGTKLVFEIGKESTRVDVHEGRVRCKRLPDGASTEIAAGRYAVAGKGLALVVRPILLVKSFQDGVAPTPEYRGTQDTWISSMEQTVNFGRGEQMQLQRLSAQQSALVRWDVTAIPPGSRVLSAELTFWVTGKLGGDCKIYALNLPFEESEATWRVAKGSMFWGAPGAQSDRDRGARPIALLAPEKPGFCTAAIGDLGVVQGWVSAPAQNYGILIAGPDANVWGVESRETAVPDRRPKLTITYISGK